ncbi:MAG: cardiolipin synthase [Clostridia bacterium]|nr:cardiolipin synthase [Clostridia bacterium]
MKRLNRLLYSNKLFALVMLLIQVAVFVAIFIWISDYSQAVLGFTTLFSAILIIIEVNRSGEPTFKMTWIVLIAIIPVFGGLLYMFMRIRTVAWNIDENYKKIQEINKRYLSCDKELLRFLAEQDKLENSFIDYLQVYGGSPAYGSTNVKYYPIGEDMYEAMRQELQNAEKFIFMEFFIINTMSRMWEEILQILKTKVSQGVEVRVMFDAMGCIATMPRDYDEYLQRLGIKCHIFSPIMPLISTHQNNRDHRKILVVDGKCAFSGGINIADEYINEKVRFGHWKDTGFKICGNGVAGFTAMFLDMWNVNAERVEDGGIYINATNETNFPETNSVNGVVVPFGDTPFDEEYVGKRAYLHNLESASDYVYIMTPYLVIDNEMFESMKYASQRGVDVKIIMPHIPDKAYAFYLARTYYKELLRAGIEIYEYTPGFIHAKMSVSDGKRAIVGTINHDYRSLYLHYECAAYMLDTPAIADMEKDFAATLAKSQRITLEDIKKFNIFTRMIGHIMRLVAPLL